MPEEKPHVLLFLFASFKNKIDLEFNHGVGRTALLILHPCFCRGTRMKLSEKGSMTPSPRFLKGFESETT